MKTFLILASVVFALIAAGMGNASAQHVGYMDIPVPGWLCDQSRVGCGPPRGNYGIRGYQQQGYYRGHYYRPPQPRSYRVCRNFLKWDGYWHTQCTIVFR